MKRRYLAIIGYDAPTSERPMAVKRYGHLAVIARSESEATRLLERHFSERKPLGFSEREIRKINPKRTPWRPGLKVLYFLSDYQVSDDHAIGVVFDE
jgi:hypothetical protein